MGRVASINHLPESVREELNGRIRRNGYCDLDSHVSWLQEQGEQISRIALGRHIQKLRAADSSLGMPRARFAEQRPSAPRNRAALLERIGQLELEKAQLLARLMSASD